MVSVYGWDLGLGTFAIFSILFAVVLPRVDYIKDLGLYGTLLLCAMGSLLVVGYSYLAGYSRAKTRSNSRKTRRKEAPREEMVVYETTSDVNDAEDAIEVGYSSSEEED